MLFRIDVAPEAVRDECARRLVALYEARDRAHAERLIFEDGIAALAGDLQAAERRATVTIITEASRRLRSMTPIPADYTDDKHWPARP